MSLLAYLVPQKLDPEPAATQALAYILRKNELAAEFIHRLGLDLGFEFGRVESERRIEGGQPDLTIFDSGGRPRIFIENKFWAGLTDAQPVQYLAALPDEDDLPSGLVFILPEQRIPTVWEELKRRSRDAYEFGNESTLDTMTQLQMGTRRMCVTSWQHVLDLLERISPSDEVRFDVLQLGGLARFGESDGFPPLCVEEFSDGGMPKRMLDYSKLVQPIVDQLKSRGLIRPKYFRLTHDWNDIGRSFNWFDESEFWLGVALVPWMNTGITPLWLRVYPGKYSNLGEHYHRLEEFFEEVQKGTDSLGYSRKYIPIRLRTGVDRGGVIRDAADQVQCIVEKLGEITGAAERVPEPA